MAEYIDKANLYKKIAELEELARNRYLDTPSNSPAYPRYMAQLDERTKLKHMVADFPSADVAEVKHGKWEEIRNPYGELEGWIHVECGREVKIKETYCPKCGTKMDGEE